MSNLVITVNCTPFLWVVAFCGEVCPYLVGSGVVAAGFILQPVLFTTVTVFLVRYFYCPRLDPGITKLLCTLHDPT